MKDNDITSVEKKIVCLEKNIYSNIDLNYIYSKIRYYQKLIDFLSEDFEDKTILKLNNKILKNYEKNIKHYEDKIFELYSQLEKEIDLFHDL